MSYIVVYENQNDGGSKGIRTITRFTDKSESKSLPGHTIIAEGVEEKEAIRLASLTPEVCYVIHAAMEALDPSKTIIPKNFLSFT